MSRLSRTGSNDPWKLQGLDEATEEVNQDEIRKLVSSLDDLKIVGVRQKPAKLMQSLREGILQRDQFTAMDLQEKGFFFAKDRKSNRSVLIPKDGQMTVITDQGIAYDLKFGDVFNGSETEVEVGFAAKDDATEKTPDATNSPQKSRYLFVLVHFNESSLGVKPESPVKPEAPATESATPTNADPTDAATPANTADDLKKKYDDALNTYEADLSKYDSDLKSYEQKVKDGEKLVKEMNSRFADWYYVVSGESFENLRQGKKTLVKAKATDGQPADPAETSSPAN